MEMSLKWPIPGKSSQDEVWKGRAQQMGTELLWIKTCLELDLFTS
jgi:hypothetical protein